MTKNCVMCRVNEDLRIEKEKETEKSAKILGAIILIFFLAFSYLMAFQMGVETTKSLLPSPEQQIKK